MIIELLIFLLSIPIAVILLRSRKVPGTVAFFHPYCNAGGGGERVLWCAIRGMQKRFPEYKYKIFTGDRDATKEQILLKARQRFGIELDPKNIEFIYLRWRRIVEADLYPRFTMLLQTIAGGFLAIEALFRLCPEIMVDSMGYPFALPVFKIFGGSKVVAYVHYPTISCDMIEVVESRKYTFNNSQLIVDSGILTSLKLYYYRLFALFYWLAGRAADSVMVNGKWTQAHITSIWARRDVSVVYPPCDVEQFLAVESVAEQLFDATKTVRMLSVGQIRPEKNHRLQLDILKNVITKCDGKGLKAQLCIAGGCRNSDDERRVAQLKKYANELDVSDYLEWKLNIPYEDLVEELSKSLISLHTMHNEHFGISVVEAMASSTVILANDSGGPQMDIVRDHEKHCVGYLANTREEYVTTVMKIVDEGRERREKIRESARKSLDRFGEAAFEKLWTRELKKVVG